MCIWIGQNAPSIDGGIEVIGDTSKYVPGSWKTQTTISKYKIQIQNMLQDHEKH